MKRLLLALSLLLSLAPPLWAVQPDEIMDDPVLEARARDISTGLRCVVCRGENIDESNADIARDMRLILRERLTVQHLKAMAQVVRDRAASGGGDTAALNRLSETLAATLVLPTREMAPAWAALQAGDMADISGLVGEVSTAAHESSRTNGANAEIFDYFVERYGEWVLMRPTLGGSNILLWGAGPFFFLIALLGGGLYLRRRSRAAEGPARLSAAEQARLDEILSD